MDAATFSAVAEKAEVYFKHRPFIQQNAHKQRRTDGIGDHHRRGNALHQMQGVLERAGNQQNDHHLHQLGHEGDRPGGQRAKDFVRPAAFDQHAVHQPAQQPSTMVETMQLKAVIPPASSGAGRR